MWPWHGARRFPDHPRGATRGPVAAADGTLSLMCRLLPMLRAAFPATRFLVRLDGGFADPGDPRFLDAEPGLDYAIAMSKNAAAGEGRRLT